MRAILHWTGSRKDEPITEFDYTGQIFELPWNRSNEAIYSVLIDKTEGEARELKRDKDSRPTAASTGGLQ